MCHRIANPKKNKQRAEPLVTKPDTKDAKATGSAGIEQPHNASKEGIGPNTRR